MRCRFTWFLLRHISDFILLSSLLGIGYFFGSPLLAGVMRAVITHDPSKISQIIRFLLIFLLVSMVLKIVEATLGGLTFNGINKYALKDASDALSHKSLDEPCYKKVRERIDVFGRFNKLMWWPCRELFAVSSVALLNLGFLCYFPCEYLIPTLLVAFAVFVMRMLSDICKGSCCYSDPSSLEQSKNYEDFLEQFEKKLRKFTWKKCIKNAFAEYISIFCEFLPVMLAMFFLTQRHLSPDVVLASVILCRSLSESLCNVWETASSISFPEVRKIYKEVKTYIDMADNEGGSAST